MSKPLTFADEAALLRFIGARNRHNAVRRLRRELRRVRIAELLAAGEVSLHRCGGQLARMFGVTRACISQDLKALGLSSGP